MHIHFRIIAEEAGTRKVAALIVRLDLIGGIHIIQDSLVPSRIVTLVPINLYDPFEAVTGGRTEQQNGFKLRIVGQLLTYLCQTITHVVEIQTQKIGRTEQLIIFAFGKETTEGHRVEMRCLELPTLLGVGNGTSLFRLLPVIATPDILDDVSDRDTGSRPSVRNRPFVVRDGSCPHFSMGNATSIQSQTSFIGNMHINHFEYPSCASPGVQPLRTPWG